MRLEEGAELYLMVMARATSRTVLDLKNFGTCQVKSFCSHKNKTYIKRVPGCYMSLLQFRGIRRANSVKRAIELQDIPVKAKIFKSKSSRKF